MKVDLPLAAGAHDGDELGAIDFPRSQPAQRVDLVVPHLVILVQLLHAQDALVRMVGRRPERQ